MKCKVYFCVNVLNKILKVNGVDLWLRSRKCTSMKDIKFCLVNM